MKRLVGAFLALAASMNQSAASPLDASGNELLPRDASPKSGKGKGKSPKPYTGVAAAKRAANKRANIRKNPRGAK